MSESRGAAYSVKEKLLLTELVKENGIVESKKTDGATVGEENRAWEHLTTCYNSQPEVNTPRTPQQLRKLWNNLKQRKRKETTALRHDMLATGGGSPEVTKLDPVLQFVSEAATGLDVVVDCPWDSTHLFEKASTTSLEVSAKPHEVATDELFYNSSADPVPYANKGLVNEIFFTDNFGDPMPSTSRRPDARFFSDDSPVQPVPSTSKGTDERFFSGNSSMEAVTPSNTEVLMESTTLSATTPKKGVAAKKRRMVPEEKLRHNRQVEATHQQQELHNLKTQIAEEELLRVRDARKRELVLQEIAKLDLQRAADEVELASLKLQQFKRQMLSEDHV